MINILTIRTESQALWANAHQQKNACYWLHILYKLNQVCLVGTVTGPRADGRGIGI